MRVITIIVHTNNLQICFYSFAFFSEKPKRGIKFSANVLSGNKKYLHFPFIARHAILQRYAELNKTFIPVRIIVP